MRKINSRSSSATTTSPTSPNNSYEREHKGLTKLTIIMLLIGVAFLIAFIVSIKIHSKTLSTKLIDWEKADIAFSCLKTFGGLLIAWIIGFPIIQIARAIYQGQKAIQQQETQIKDCEEYIYKNKDLLNDLINQYYDSIKNFIEDCPKFHFTLNEFTIKRVGYNLFNKNSLCAYYLKKDGFSATEKTYLILDEEKKNYNNLSFFINGLKNRLATQWTDTNTLDVAVYLVFRNNLIKYFYRKHIKQYNCKTIEELCATFGKGNVDSSIYTYYYLYKTDIFAPIIPTFHSVCAQVKATFEQMEKQSLERSYFGCEKITTESTICLSETHEPTVHDLPKELQLENLPLKPIEKVDVMTGEEFEKYMEKYFIKKGYKVTRTPLSGDYGIDLIIEHEFGKIGVQLKRYFEKVSLSAVQEVVAGLKHYELCSGMVITSSYFQPSAIRLAKDNNITLWDRDTLIENLEA